MKKSAQETNHTKAFITAIGIAFAFLALVVLYVAFAKGGLDIRSRASGQSCITTTAKSCPTGYSFSRNIAASATNRLIECCKVNSTTHSNAILPSLTKNPTSTPTKALKAVLTKTTLSPQPTCAIKSYNCTVGTSYCGPNNARVVCQRVYSNTCNQYVVTWVTQLACSPGTKCTVISAGNAQCKYIVNKNI